MNEKEAKRFVSDLIAGSHNRSKFENVNTGVKILATIGWGDSR